MAAGRGVCVVLLLALHSPAGARLCLLPTTPGPPAEAIWGEFHRALRWRLDVTTEPPGPRDDRLALHLSDQAVELVLSVAEPAGLIRFAVPREVDRRYPLAAARRTARRLFAGLARRWPVLGAAPLEPLPGGGEGLLRQARTAARQGDLAGAAELYQRLGTPAALAELAQAYRLAGDDERAEAALRLAVAAAPGEVGLRLALADLLRDTGELGLALEQLDSAAERSRGDAELAALAAVQWRWGRHNAAARTLERRVAVADDPCGARLDCLAACLAVGDLSGARVWLRAALALAPDRAEVFWWEAELERRAGNRDAAMRAAAGWLRRADRTLSPTAEALVAELFHAEAEYLRLDLLHRLRRGPGSTDEVVALARRGTALEVLASSWRNPAALEAARLLGEVAAALRAAVGGDAWRGLDRAGLARRLDDVSRLVG